MSPTTTGPTAKQQEVLAGLQAGKTVDDLAKQMKVTKSAIYGHMRLLRDAGIELPEVHTGSSSPAPASGTTPTPRRSSARGGRRSSPAPAANGTSFSLDGVFSTVAQQIEAQRALLEQRFAAIDGEVAQHQAAIEALGTQKVEVTQAIERLQAVAASITGAEQAAEAEATTAPSLS